MSFTIQNYATKYIDQIVEITIDRPLNSRHPKHDFVYELNYGYVSGTKAPDGEEVDAYVIGPTKPLTTFTGKCVAVIHRTDDNDDKLVVVPSDMEDIQDEEIRCATLFQEQFFQSNIVRKPSA